MEKQQDPQTDKVSFRRTSEMGPYGRFWDRTTHIPCQNPPFGNLVAVNVNTGNIAWNVPLGIVEELEAKGVRNTGTLNVGGSITTAGGLIFIAATNDHRFRAFESKTGKELWMQTIDTNAHCVPITYLGKDGRQYVVVMAGGGGFFSAPPDDSLIAFSLPGPGSRPGERWTPTAANPAVSSSKIPPGVVRSAPSRAALPAGKGKDVVRRMCGGCHPFDVVTGERHDRAGWSTVVQTMVARGATGTNEEIEQVINYLTTHFGS